jgi:hypothetical protein
MMWKYFVFTKYILGSDNDKHCIKWRFFFKWSIVMIGLGHEIGMGGKWEKLWLYLGHQDTNTIGGTQLEMFQGLIFEDET